MVHEIKRKLAAAAVAAPNAFGTDRHGFHLRAPLSEGEAAAFEAAHGVRLPEAYRRFLLEIGDGGAGPGVGVRPLADTCTYGLGPCEPGHLTEPSQYLPDGFYRDEDWSWPPYGRERGTLTVAEHGCNLTTQLIVTGPARGRLFNVDHDGAGPYVLEDKDFLAWYERWLDELISGYQIGWFGEKLPGDEPALTAILADDPSAHRRARAARSLTKLAGTSVSIVDALRRAAMDADPIVRIGLLEILEEDLEPELAALEPQARAALRDPVAVVRAAAVRALGGMNVTDIASIARSLANDPAPQARVAALRTLADLRCLRLADLVASLTADDVRLRRTAATLLLNVVVEKPDDVAGTATSPALTELTEVVIRTLDDDDARVCNGAINAARRHGIDHDPQVHASIADATSKHPPPDPEELLSLLSRSSLDDFW
jgi:hypothetical protein